MNSFAKSVYLDDSDNGFVKIPFAGLILDFKLGLKISASRMMITLFYEQLR